MPTIKPGKMDRSLLFTVLVIVITSFINLTLASAQETMMGATVISSLNNPETLIPKDNIPPSSSVKEDRLGAPSTEYLHIAGSVFVPMWNNVTVTYAGSGCVYLTGSNLFINYPVSLPYNSIIKQLRFYYKDNSATNDGTLRLSRYDDGLDYTDLAELKTSGSTGWGTTTLNLDIPIDYDNYSYVIYWAPGLASSDLQFCGVRIGYTRPLFGAVALPLILK
jgi:hypothetical protein